MKKLFLFLTAVLMTALCALAQQTVSGTVVSAGDNEPLPGATVLPVGGGQGTATDIDGNFQMTVPDNVKKLSVSYVGMNTKEVAITPGKMVIALDANDNKLDEVMVVAYGTAKKSAFTGSAAVVNSEAIEQAQVTNALDALSGKVAGVQLVNSTGDPATSSPTIRIRGISSINAGNAPLVIVDGATFSGDMNTLNSNDIESMTILKDAAANALYGARGANGVILITTKRAKTGSNARITLDAKWGSNSRSQQEYNHVLSPAQYYETYYRSLYNYASYPATVEVDGVTKNVGGLGMSPADATAWANAQLCGNDYGLGYNVYTVPQGQYLVGADGRFNPNATLGRTVNYRGQDYYLTPDNWLDEAYHNSLRQEYNFSVANSTDKSTFFMSVGYLNNEGITMKSGFERLTARLAADTQATSWLKVGANFSYANYNAKSNISSDGSSSSSGNLFAFSSQVAPIYPLYMRDGNGNIMVDDLGIIRYDFGDKSNAGLERPFLGNSNAFSDVRYNTNKNTGNTFTGSGFFEISFLKDFKFTSNNSFGYDNSRSTAVTNPYYGSYAASNGIVTVGSGGYLDYSLQQLLNWVHSFGNHNVTLLLGHEYYHLDTNILSASKSNMFDPNIGELAMAVVDGSANSYTSTYNNEGWLFRGQYDYNGKYFGSISFRRDGSSRFHPDHRWGNFWSFGGAWIMSKESFLSDVTWIDMLKLKASYGEQGNDNIGGYRYTNTYTVVNYDGNAAVVPGSMGNPNITWEKGGNFNAGVEFSFFNSRLSGSVEGFYRKTSDMLFYFPLPISYGYTGYYDNIGDMANAGFELDLSGTIVNTKDFTWDVNLNMTWYKNKITRLPEERRTMWCDGVKGFQSGNYFYGEGESIYSFWMPKYAGVDPDTGKSLWWKDTYELYPADYPDTDLAGTPIKDADNQPIVNGQVKTDDYSSATYHNCGTALPDLYGGFGTHLEYKGFDLSVDFNYSIGGLCYDSNYASEMGSPYAGGGAGTNINADIFNAWTPDNRHTNVPRYMFGDQTYSSTSDRFLTDASYLSLQNINFGYTLPASLTRKIQLSKVRVYLSCDNVWLWSKRQGLDPRQSITGSTSAASYSPIRTISGGLTVNF